MDSDSRAVKSLTRRVEYLQQRASAGKPCTYDVAEIEALCVALARIKQFQQVRKFYWQWADGKISNPNQAMLDLYQTLEQIELAENAHSGSGITHRPFVPRPNVGVSRPTDSKVRLTP